MSNKRVTQEQFINRLIQSGTGNQYIGQFSGMKIPAHFKCICGRHKYITPRAALKHSGCGHCSTGRSLKEPHILLQQLDTVFDGTVHIIGDYFGMDAQTEFQCVHGHRFRIMPRNLMRHKQCPQCQKQHKVQQFKKKIRYKLYLLTGYKFNIVEYCKSSVLQKLKLHCNVCGNDFSIICSNVLRRGGCPHCSGIARKSQQEFLQDVASVHGNKYEILSQYKNNRQAVLVKCRDCDSQFSILPTNLLKGQGCRTCRLAGLQKLIFEFLSKFNVQFMYDRMIQGCVNPLTGKHLRFDFILPKSKVIIQTDGVQHFVDIGRTGNSSLENVSERDLLKNQWAHENGYVLIRISNSAHRTDNHLTVEQFFNLFSGCGYDQFQFREALLPYNFDKFVKN